MDSNPPQLTFSLRKPSNASVTAAIRGRQCHEPRCRVSSSRYQTEAIVFWQLQIYNVQHEPSIQFQTITKLQSAFLWERPSEIKRNVDDEY